MREKITKVYIPVAAKIMVKMKIDKNEDRYGSAWGEDMIVGTDGFLVGKDDSAKLNDAV